VVGVYEGREREILYVPPPDGAGDHVARASTDIARAGSSIRREYREAVG
jgi:hypothetical protein